MLPNEIAKDGIKDFILGGNADFTILNSDSGNEIHIKVVKRKKKDGSPAAGYWLYYGKEYIGFIKENLAVGHPIKKLNLKIWDDARMKFNYFWKMVLAGNIPDNMHLLHNGTCCRCGRKLTQVESITNGIGPECAKKTKLF